MNLNEDENDENLGDLFQGNPRSKKIKYPKCYIDKKHDGDPICKTCALELYDALPKNKFKYPRNCWNCEENGISPSEDTDLDEPFYEE